MMRVLSFMRGTVARPSDSEQGAVAVEFALVSLPFLAIVFCIAEAGLDNVYLSYFDGATRAMARQVEIGTVQQSAMSMAAFKTAYCARLPSFMSCDRVVFSIKTVTKSFYSLTTTVVPGSVPQYALIPPSLNQSQNSFCPGLSGQYVALQALYIMPVISGIWTTSAVSYNGSSVRTLGSTSVFRNEGFSALTSYPGC